MTDRLSLATRTRKARRNSACPVCRAPIAIGQQIARLTRPPAWCHVQCVPIVAAALARLAGNVSTPSKEGKVP